jgi:hypothetical protein
MNSDIATIQQLWRMRQRWHRAEKSLILQGKAVCRAWTSGDKDAASDLWDSVLSGADEEAILIMALTPFIQAIERFEPMRKSIEKELKKAARKLPVHPWVKDVKGFGDLNLAALVGECGDVGAYRNHSALWKRMGLAVIEGERQRKKANAEDALVHGYNPSRRAVAYLLGDTIIKGNGTGPYRQLYLARKEIEIARVDDVKTKAHAHNRAARYMVKRLLKDFWRAWRRAKVDLAARPNDEMPAAEIMPQGMGEAISVEQGPFRHRLPTQLEDAL